MVLDADTVSAIGFSDDVAEELLRADIAVLPSLEEGDPISTYEAAAHGLPVIAYDPSSTGSRAYTALTDEFLARQKDMRQ